MLKKDDGSDGKNRIKKSETIIVSVGGSLIVPKEINLSFLSALKKCLVEQIAYNKRFVLVCGGGYTGRVYQKSALEMNKISSEELDWIGIYGTWLNTRMVNAIFENLSRSEIITDPTKSVSLTSKKPIVVAGGWKPGRSTDYVATMLAKKFGASRLVNLTNIDHIYDKDPNKYSDAKKIKDINWPKFRSLLPKDWDPGLHTPFDPIASKEAEKIGLTVAIINGNKMKQFEYFIDQKKFNGSLIKPVDNCL